MSISSSAQAAGQQTQDRNDSGPIAGADITAVLLAGGQSSRMGTDKALLLRRPMQDHQSQAKTSSSAAQNQLSYMLGLLSGFGLKQTILSRNEQGGSTSKYYSGSVIKIPDNFSALGPLAGIEAAMKISLNQPDRSKALLIIPVDLPLLTAETLQCLLTHGQTRQQACYFKHHYLPLFLPINDTLLTDVQNNLLTQKNLSIRALCQQQQAQELTAPHTEPLTNTNTPLQWQQAGFEPAGVHI